MIDPDDERTALSRRRDAEEPVDGDTVPRAALRSASRVRSAGDDGAPRAGDAPDRDAPTQAATTSAPGGPRRRGAADDPVDAPTITRSRSRGRTETATQPEDHGAHAGVTPGRGDVAPLGSGRVAHPPSAVEPYRPRDVPSAVSRRAQPAPSPPQAYVDTTAAEAARRRRGRRRAIVVAVGASVLVLAGVIALVALLTTG